MPLDLKTLTFVNLITTSVGIVAIGILWGRHRHRYQGLLCWLTAMALQALALLLLVLRGMIPDFLSIIAANFGEQVGTWLLLVGLERFFGRPRNHWVNLGLLAVFFVGLTYWTVVVPDLLMRNLLIGACMATLMAQTAWLLLVRVPGNHSATQMIGFVALGYVFANLARMAGQLVKPYTNNDFFLSNELVDTLAFLAWLTLTLLLVLALILLVNQRLLREVRVQEEKFTKAFQSAPYAVLLTRKDNSIILEVNQEFERMSGWRRHEVLHKTPLELRLWSSEEAQRVFIAALAEHRPIRNAEIEFRQKDGSFIVGVLSAETIEIAGEAYVISSVGDVTEQSRLREQLKILASHDALTGLPNRRLFYDRFSLALSNAVRNKNKLAVMSLDLDRFKTVNDTYGHEVGDLVLTETSRRLSQSLRAVDIVARFGGDEFVVLLWEVQSPEDATKVALKILEQFRVPFAVTGQTLSVRASLGVALYPDHGTDLETLLRKSDQALYTVKDQGRDNYRLTVS